MGWEAEELRKNALVLESRVRQAESQAETATTVQLELEGQLEEANTRIKGLEVKAKDCESIPGLWRHIEESTKQITQLKAAQEGLQVTHPGSCSKGFKSFCHCEYCLWEQFVLMLHVEPSQGEAGVCWRWYTTRLWLMTAYSTVY